MVVTLSAIGVPVIWTGVVTGRLIDGPGGSAFCILCDEPVLMQAPVRRQRIIMTADSIAFIIFFLGIFISMDL